MAASIQSLLAAELDVSEDRARTLLHAMVDEIRRRVTQGNGVRIRDFGTFKKQDGRVQFIPDPSLSRAVNHRFEGLEPETLYLTEPTDTPSEPYPRPSEASEDPGFDFDMEVDDADIEDVAGDGDSVSATASSPESAPSTPDESPPEAEPDGGDETGPPAEAVDAEDDVAATQDEPASDGTETEDADESSADEPPSESAEPDSFFPRLDQIIGVEPSDTASEAEVGASPERPLTNVRAALAAGDSAAEPSSEAEPEAETSKSPIEGAPASRSSEQRQDPWEAALHSSPHVSTDSSHGRRPGGDGDWTPNRMWARNASASRSSTSNGSVASDTLQRIGAGLVVLVLLAAGLWFVVGQFRGPDPAYQLPPSNAPSAASRTPSTDAPSPAETRGESPSSDTRRPPSESVSDAYPSEPASSMDRSGGSASATGSTADALGGAVPDGIDASAGGWTVIIRSRSSQVQAEQWLREHREQFLQRGLPVDVLRGRSDGRTWYRVAVGHVSSLDEARRMMDQHADLFPRDAWPLRLDS